MIIDNFSGKINLEESDFIFRNDRQLNCWSKFREKKLERKSRSWRFGVRPAHKRACRRRSSSSFSLIGRLLSYPSLLQWSSCLSCGFIIIRDVSDLGVKTRLVWSWWCGEDARSMDLVPGRWRLPQIRRRRLLSPRGGSVFGFAVVGSSPRGVKASSASSRRL